MLKRSTPTDKGGREIKAGDLIVYGHALGRCAGLQYGKVLAIKFKEEAVYDPKANKHNDTLVPHFTVQGVDQDLDGWEEPSLKRKGTLQFGDRILVVRRDQVPAGILKLLDGVSDG